MRVLYGAFVIHNHGGIVLPSEEVLQLRQSHRRTRVNHPNKEELRIPENLNSLPPEKVEWGNCHFKFICTSKIRTVLVDSLTLFEKKKN